MILICCSFMWNAVLKMVYLWWTVGPFQCYRLPLLHSMYEVYIYLSLIWMRHLIIKWKHLKLTDLCIAHHTIIMDEFIKIKYIAWNVYVYNFQWGSSITEMTKKLYTDWILYITFIHNFKFKSSNRFAT